MADAGSLHPLPSAGEWEDQRSFITKLREDPNNKLADIMKEMLKRGFHGTEAVYKKKFREWGLPKYISSAAAIEAERKRKQRHDDGRPQSEIRINGRVVSSDKIERHLKRAKNTEKGSSSNLAPSTTVIVQTPEEISSSTPEQLRAITVQSPVLIDPIVEETIELYRPRISDAFNMASTSPLSMALNQQPWPLGSDFSGVDPYLAGQGDYNFQIFSSPWDDPSRSMFNAASQSQSYDVSRIKPGPPTKAVRQPIHQAAQSGHQRVVEALLRARPEFYDVPGEKGETPLWLAAQGGFVGTATVLANYGADINVALTSNGSQRRPIHQAAQNGHVDMVRFLLQRNALFDEPEEEGATALCLACQEGHTEIVRLLLEANANPAAATFKSGRISLHQACQNGHLEVVKLLLQYRVPIDCQEKDGTTGLWLACQQGHAEIARLLIERGANVNIASPETGRTPLHQACQNGHEEIVWLLLDNLAQIDISKQEQDGVTPLWLASQQGYTAIVSRLLALGANPNSASLKSGRTPLHQASQNGKEEIVRLLLDKNAIVDAGEEDGATPLWLAAQGGYSGIVKLLLSRGANPNVKSVKNKRSPLHQASQSGHFEAVTVLLENGAVPDSTEEDGWSALMMACQEGHLNIISALLDRGAQINLLEKDGATGLWMAAQQGHTAVVEFLLKKGARQLATHMAKRMPIHQAAQNNHVEALKLLVEHGADINCRSDANKQTGGITPLWLASQGGHDAIVEYLIEKGAEVTLD
ncbi:ankyrin repeat-containing domain protein [Cladorrhinum sp. PSN332]|nr:ankyrin repeat-containing domain protein [Cladorrhinum sp. PSN332]